MKTTYKFAPWMRVLLCTLICFVPSLCFALGVPTNAQVTGINPENGATGAAAVWIQDGFVKARVFNDTGTQSNILLLSSGGAATNLSLTGQNPQDPDQAAGAVWLEGSTVQARVFSSSGLLSPIWTLSTPGIAASNLLITGTTPGNATQGAAAIWLEGGNVYGGVFSSTDVTPPYPLSSGGGASNLCLTGNIPFSSALGGVAAAWLQAGQVKSLAFTAFGPSTLQTLSPGPATALHITGEAPYNPATGAAAVWIETGVVKGCTFDETTHSTVFTLSAGGNATLPQISGDTPKNGSTGAAAIWLEGTALRGITFDPTGPSPTTSAFVDTATGPVLSGATPESGLAAAAAWTTATSPDDLKMWFFDASGVQTYIHSNGIFGTDLLLTGFSPDIGVAALYLTGDGTVSVLVNGRHISAFFYSLSNPGATSPDLTGIGLGFGAVWVENGIVYGRTFNTAVSSPMIDLSSPSSGGSLTGVSRSNKSGSQTDLYAVLQWPAPVGFIPTQYLIYRNSALISIVSEATFLFENHYLQKKTAYTYSVVAQDALDYTFPIGTITVTTP